MKTAARKLGRPGVRAIARPKKQIQPLVDTVLLEPNSLFRVGLEYLLGQAHFRVVAQTEIAPFDGLPAFARDTPLLFILGSSESLEDIVAIAGDVKARYPTARVACIRKTYESADMTALLGSGVDGLLLRNIDAAILVKSLDLIMAGESIFPHKLLKFSPQDDREVPPRSSPPDRKADAAPEPVDGSHATLSTRERDVLKLLVNGDSNKLIALKLAITEATVKVHVKSVLRKIQVQNRTQAAIWAINALSNEKSSL